jgi:putative ABC transport system permease protein
VALALQEQFKQSASVMTQQSLLDSVFKQATAIMVYPFSFIGLLFLAVSCIIVYSTCRISLRHESRTYGIYKSLGLTSRRIRLAIALGIALLATLGALLGIAIGVYSLPLLLERVLGSYGIVQMPLVLDWSSIMLASLASVAAAVLASWIASAPLRQTSPRILVTDT